MSYAICPACGSATVHQAPQRAFRIDGSGPGLGFHALVATGSPVVGHSELTTLLCVTCGHVRQFVADPDALARVAAAWPRMQPPSG
jgi:hypothetical protein